MLWLNKWKVKHFWSSHLPIYCIQYTLNMLISSAFQICSLNTIILFQMRLENFYRPFSIYLGNFSNRNSLVKVYCFVYKLRLICPPNGNILRYYSAFTLYQIKHSLILPRRLVYSRTSELFIEESITLSNSHKTAI